MGISRSTFYHKAVKEEVRLQKDLVLKSKIEKVLFQFPGYGYRRIHEHLLNEGLRVNGKRIRRVMRMYSLFSSRTKLSKPRGRAVDGRQLVFSNKIAGLKLRAPNQVWATDITYIKLRREYIYLSAIIDIYTRKIVGWSVSKNLSHKFCLESLKVAIRKRKPKAGLIHHSDRGVQYTCVDYIEFLEKHDIVPSMSQLGTPQDNAFIEAFFKTLKREEVYARNYQTVGDVIRSLPKFIDEVYNIKRLHSSLGYKSPEEYESEVMKLKPADRPVQKIWGKAV